MLRRAVPLPVEPDQACCGDVPLARLSYRFALHGCLRSSAVLREPRPNLQFMRSLREPPLHTSLSPNKRLTGGKRSQH